LPFAFHAIRPACGDVAVEQFKDVEVRVFVVPADFGPGGRQHTEGRSRMTRTIWTTGGRAASCAAKPQAPVAER